MKHTKTVTITVNIIGIYKVVLFRIRFDSIYL